MSRDEALKLLLLRHGVENATTLRCARCDYGVFRPIADEESKPAFERAWQCAHCGHVGRGVEAEL